MTSSQGWWLYAVTDSADPARFQDAGLSALTGAGAITGVGGGHLVALSAAGLTAVVEPVRLEEFGEEALRRNLEDLAWLESTARAHHQVVQTLASLVQVVPVRLATVYSGDDSVRAMLTARAAEFRQVLRQITGHAEWGVKAFAAPAAAPAARAGALTAGASGAGAGAAYLRRRRDELAASRQGRTEALASAEQVHAALSGLAAQTRLHPPQSPQLTGSKAVMLLNAAYLVPEPDAGPFGQAVADLQARLPLQLELTGPWPPYSFASLPEPEKVPS